MTNKLTANTCDWARLPQTLRIETAAALLDVCEEQVRRYIKNGQLRAIDVSADGKGKKSTAWRIDRDDLIAFRDGRAINPDAQRAKRSAAPAPELASLCAELHNVAVLLRAVLERGGGRQDEPN